VGRTYSTGGELRCRMWTSNAWRAANVRMRAHVAYSPDGQASEMWIGEVPTQGSHRRDAIAGMGELSISATSYAW
jgi:hypothetical protein